MYKCEYEDAKNYKYQCECKPKYKSKYEYTRELQRKDVKAYLVINNTVC